MRDMVATGHNLVVKGSAGVGRVVWIDGMGSGSREAIGVTR